MFEALDKIRDTEPQQLEAVPQIGLLTYTEETEAPSPTNTFHEYLYKFSATFGAIIPCRARSKTSAKHKAVQMLARELYGDIYMELLKHKNEVRLLSSHARTPVLDKLLANLKRELG